MGASRDDVENDHASEDVTIFCFDEDVQDTTWETATVNVLSDMFFFDA